MAFKFGSNKDDEIIGSHRSDLIISRKGDDTIQAGKGNDVVLAGKGNDIIYGDEGSDILKGGKGNDEITGGQDRDYLFGGFGDDTFKYTYGDGKDVIFDFNKGSNQLQLSHIARSDVELEETRYLGKRSTLLKVDEHNSVLFYGVKLNDFLADFEQKVVFENSPATIDGEFNGAVAEDVTLSISGVVQVTDPDPDESKVVAVAGIALYGSYVVNEDGTWEYVLDNTNFVVQSLGATEFLTDEFNIESVDGSASQVIEITIQGNNDLAVFAGDLSGTVIEDSVVNGQITGTATASDIDNDNVDNVFQLVAAGTLSNAGFGSFEVSASGEWTYVLDNENTTVNSLDDGETLNDSITLTSIDGTEQAVNITIQGATDNALPTIENNLELKTLHTFDGATTYLTLSNSLLLASDKETSDLQLEYILTQNVSNGVLNLNGVELEQNDSFTQADITNGWVVYETNVSDISLNTDVFKFDLSDGESVRADNTFNIVFGVNTYDDVMSDSDGLLSLREAVILSNGMNGLQTIYLEAGQYNLTQQGNDGLSIVGDLDIRDSLTVNGAGRDDTIIDANQTDRVFDIGGGGTSVHFNDLTITGGLTDNGGGGISVSKFANAHIENVRLTQNEASSGGGIRTLGDVVILDSLIDSNMSSSLGGAIAGSGDGSVTVTDSKITDNMARFGAGIHADYFFDVNIKDSEITQNIAQSDGGGIDLNRDAFLILNDSLVAYNEAEYGGGISLDRDAQASINSATIHQNTALDDGGGIRMLNDAKLSVANSELSENHADSGGGISASGFGELSVLNSLIVSNLANRSGGGINLGFEMQADISTSTFYSNQATFGGAISLVQQTELDISNASIFNNIATNGGGGVWSFSDVPVEVYSSIIANNPDSRGQSDIIDNGFNSSFNSLGNNLIGAVDTADNHNFSITLGDVFGTNGSPLDPLLNALADNGGPTKTLALSDTSPAIDAGNINDSSIDQRGAEIADGNGDTNVVRDIGAYEYLGVIPNAQQEDEPLINNEFLV